MEGPQENLMEIAKRIHGELKTEPLVSHNAVIQMLSILLSHRATLEQAEQQTQAQRDQMAAQFAIAEANQRPRILT